LQYDCLPALFEALRRARGKKGIQRFDEEGDEAEEPSQRVGLK
jgi:hypothetical protein